MKQVMDSPFRAWRWFADVALAKPEDWWLENSSGVIQALGLFMHFTLIGLVVALVAQESLWLGGVLIGLLLTVALHVRLRH